MLIKNTCRYIAEKVIENIEHDETNLSVDALYKRLSILAIYTLLTITVISVGAYFGILWHLIVATAAMATLRIINGGSHSKSPDMCFVVTTSIILINPVLQDWTSGYDFYIFVACLIGYVAFAPHREHETKQYWMRKSIVVIGLILAYIVSKDVLYTYFILLPDLIYRNQNLNKLKWRS